ncbi:MAG: HD domain-containing protein [Candidatus Magasanikbacteria bacterium]|nr:HD domain-containing protein [Candidatus Magasanikbacteria bacterium]
MSSALVQKTAEYVKLKLHHEPSGHDWYHVRRVWQMSRLLQKEEGGDLELVELSALLHNLREHGNTAFYEEKGSLALFGMMDVLGIEEELKQKILHVVEDGKYQGDDTKKPMTIEGMILQDANWLDALGAVGIARAFASGGFIGRPIYDPDIKVRKRMNKQLYQQKKKDTTSFNYLYEKAFRVAEILNTTTAKRIGATRIAFMKNFIEEFVKEWEEKDQ